MGELIRASRGRLGPLTDFRLVCCYGKSRRLLDRSPEFSLAVRGDDVLTHLLPRLVSRVADDTRKSKSWFRRRCRRSTPGVYRAELKTAGSPGKRS